MPCAPCLCMCHMLVICERLWNDMFTIWYVNDIIYVMIWHARQHVRDIICKWYDICIIWYDTLENMICVWDDICLTWWNVCYDWHEIWCFGIMHNPNICMECYDKMIWYKGKRKGFLYTIINEKCWDFMHHCVLCIGEYLLFIMVRTRMLRGKKTIIIFIIMLRRSLFAPLYDRWWHCNLGDHDTYIG